MARTLIALALLCALASPTMAMGIAPHAIGFPADGHMRTAGIAFGLLFLALLWLFAMDWCRERGALGLACNIGAVALFLLIALCATGAMAARRHPVCVAVDIEGIPSLVCSRSARRR